MRHRGAAVHYPCALRRRATSVRSPARTKIPRVTPCSEAPPYYRALDDAWNDGLRHALNNLPAFEWEDPPHPLQVVATDRSGQMQG
jgi:hypothetical protein